MPHKKRPDPAQQRTLEFATANQTDHASSIIVWQCCNCGQQFFSEPHITPPDICHYCNDMTTWRQKKVRH